MFYAGCRKTEKENTKNTSCVLPPSKMANKSFFSVLIENLQAQNLIRPHPRRKGLWFVMFDASANSIREELERFHRGFSRD